MMRNLIISGKKLIKQNETINTRPVSIFWFEISNDFDINSHRCTLPMAIWFLDYYWFLLPSRFLLAATKQ